MGNIFYVHLVSGGSTELQGTFNIIINCDTFDKLNNTFLNYYKSGLESCPTPDMDMIMSYKQAIPVSVKTSIDVNDWLPYSYNVLIYTAQAIDINQESLTV
jgi:hypothetical protein